MQISKAAGYKNIASLKAFFHYLEYKEVLDESPFAKLDIRFREAKLLPKTIPFHSIQAFLSALYAQKERAESVYQRRCCIRNIAVMELLFATGMRISELCSLKPSDQSVRFRIDHYAKLAGITQHLTPHMFRHSEVFSRMALFANVGLFYESGKKKWKEIGIVKDRFFAQVLTGFFIRFFIIHMHCAKPANAL